MNSRLYPKLAWQNLRKNGRFYLPYILTIIGTSGAFYILMALAGASDLPQQNRYAYLSMFVSFGAGVIGIFSVIFLFYTNSFLMKQRKKELGLYNVLGMGKRHIARVLAWETLYTTLLGTIGGVAFGMLFQKAVTVLLYRLMRFEVPYGFYISWKGIACSFCLFGAILFVNLLFNLGRIHVQNPIELLREGASGEREPKTKWPLAVIGILALGAGYSIAVVTQNAVEAITVYFLAVILVIIGTYCLFTAVSIVVLKLLRKNTSFYYQTKNFIGTSGMLYRMKRNAVGLANICILSTMVLVMVSGTLSLYVGTEDVLDTRYPSNLVAELRYDPTEENTFQPDVFLERLTAGVETTGRTVENVNTMTGLSFGVGRTGDSFTADREEKSVADTATMVFVTAQEYAILTGTAPETLAENEILFYGQGKKVSDALSIDFSNSNNPDGPQRVYRIIRQMDSFPRVGDYSVDLMDVYYAVVADDAALVQLYSDQAAAYGDDASAVTWRVLLNVDGTEQQQMDCAKTVSDAHLIAADKEDVGSWEWYSMESRAANASDFYSLNGGFFFLGIFLGILFIMATVLIIYYKQITEGYEDRERFQIMQKVGLDKAEIKRSINEQILVVFFAPLIVAAVHVAFDFRLVRLLLTLFGLTNATLTLLCTVSTLLAFIAVYGVVYALTAKAYYRIVS